MHLTILLFLYAQVGSNYAPTILPQAEAQRKHGTPQVLYTLPSIDGSDPESAVISESGAMNCFFLLDKVNTILLLCFCCLPPFYTVQW